MSVIYVLSSSVRPSVRPLTAPVFKCSKEIHNTLPVMRKIQYKQHQYHDGRNIQIKILKCIKHECKIKEEEDNRHIL